MSHSFDSHSDLSIAGEYADNTSEPARDQAATGEQITTGEQTDSVHHKYWFTSDNTAGVCPAAHQGLLDALAATAPVRGNAGAYGDDPITARARTRLQELFEIECAIHFVFTGTAANSLALAAMCESYHRVVAHSLGHVNTDECNAPEFFRQGLKLETVGNSGESAGRSETGSEMGADRALLTVDQLLPIFEREADVHFSPVGALSLTQMTELGGLYTPEQVQALCALAHRHNAHVHMDGARFANAVAALDVAPADLTWRAGVDILCFGGTKQGMPGSEAILIFNPELARNFHYRVKQAGQLASKMSVLSGPWVNMLAGGQWLDYARHANQMTARLGQALAALPGLQLLEPIQGNVIFVEIPASAVRSMHAAGWHFYQYTARHHRLMCSWATEQSHIDAFIRDLKRALRAADATTGK